jgi:hypothetical protein
MGPRISAKPKEDAAVWRSREAPTRVKNGKKILGAAW